MEEVFPLLLMYSYSFFRGGWCQLLNSITGVERQSVDHALYGFSLHLCRAINALREPLHIGNLADSVNRERQLPILVPMDFFRRARRNGRARDSPKLRFYHNAPVPFEDPFGVLFELFGTIYPTKDIVNMISTANHVFTAYDEQGRCIACALVNDAGSKGGLYLMLFGVRQAAQGRGAGTYFLEKVLRWARYAGYTFIYLHVHADNYKAIGLYEKVGFQKHEYLPNFYETTPKRPAHGFRMVLSFWWSHWCSTAQLVDSPSENLRRHGVDFSIYSRSFLSSYAFSFNNKNKVSNRTKF